MTVRDGDLWDVVVKTIPCRTCCEDTEHRCIPSTIRIYNGRVWADYACAFDNTTQRVKMGESKHLIALFNYQ